MPDFLPPGTPPRIPAGVLSRWLRAFLNLPVVRKVAPAVAGSLPSFVPNDWLIDWINGHPELWGSSPSLLAWGRGVDGQLGDGKGTSSGVPVWVNVPDAWQVSAGQMHSLAISGQGDVWGWGYNYVGCLGDLTTTRRLSPRKMQLGAGTRAMSIAAGTAHSLVCTTQGRVLACGHLPGGAVIPTPTDVGLADCVQVAAGEYFSLALKTDGSVWAWGDSGQLGPGTPQAQPAQVLGLGQKVTAISGGSNHAAALLADGTVAAWGSNDHGQCGQPSSPWVMVPTVVPNLDNVVAVSAGWLQTVAVRADGSLWAWGYVATSTGGDRAPSALPAVTGVVHQAAAGALMIILQIGQQLKALGSNSEEALGAGSIQSAWTVPVPVLTPATLSPPPWVIATGDLHALVATGPLPDWMKA